jgi:hypothetical protein
LAFFHLFDQFEFGHAAAIFANIRYFEVFLNRSCLFLALPIFFEQIVKFGGRPAESLLGGVKFLVIRAEVGHFK